MDGQETARPLVSICVPTYNGERHLRDCLDGLLGQTFRDFELLLVDDCSRDSTRNILDEYALADDRIRVVFNERNRGLVGNWNHCIGLARGEWIKFAFQDDLFREDCLEKMLAVATRPIVFCRREFLFELGTSSETIQVYNNLPSIPDLVGEATDVPPETVRIAVLREPRNFFGEPTAALLHHSLFERFGLFNTDLAQFCDLEYWIRVSISTGLSYTNEPLVTFRYHSTSTSAKNRDPLNDERISVFDQLVMLHEFSYNPHYSPLRAQAIAAVPKRNFKRELVKKAVWAHARARALTSQEKTPDNNWIRRWNDLVTCYPHLTHSPWYLAYRAKELWLRHFGWRISAN